MKAADSVSMRIRWKLLILMLGISLVPLLILRWNGERGLRNLGNELAAATRAVLIERTSQQLLTMIEEHALVLRRERELLELALELQTAELEAALAGLRTKKPAGQAVIEDRKGSAATGVRNRETGSGRIKPFDVSFNDITILNAPVDNGDSESLRRKLQNVIPAFRSLALKHPDMVLWQWIVFRDGVRVVYPAVSRMPMMMFQRHRHRLQWFSEALGKNGVSWSSPTIDPLTRQITLVVAKPFGDDRSTVAGVNAIVVPLGQLLQEDAHVRHLSHGAASMLVRVEKRSEAFEQGIRIIAREDDRKSHRHRWMASVSDEWLPSDRSDPDFQRLFEDLKKNRSGVAEVTLDGVEKILAYGSIDNDGTSLMLVAGKAEVLNEAVAMEKFMLRRFTHLIGVTGTILAVVVALVVVISMFFSKSITNNIQKLVEASRKLAQGDFNIRTEIRTGDEIGELGRTFNRMIPALEERVQIKQALDVAMEIQQNLLPQAKPDISGIDVAGTSLYCDETGGDFFDFLDFCCRDHDTLGVAVGDVSGHGIPAALLMATARAFLRCRVTQTGDIAAIINDVNQLLVEDTAKTSQFLTLFYMELQVSKNRLQWIRAGHDAALLYDPQSDRFDELMGAGLSMGIDEDHRYAANTHSNLTAGQVICIGTDGIWETVNPQKEMFGRKRLEKIIQKHHAAPAEDIIIAVTDELARFRGEEKQHDDATLVVIKLLKPAT